MLISYNIHTWCLHTTDNLWYFNIYYLNPLPNIKNVWYFSLFLFSFFCKQYSTNTFTPLQLPPPHISNVCSETAAICCHIATDHLHDYIHFTIYSLQLHFWCSEAQAIAVISPKTCTLKLQLLHNMKRPTKWSGHVKMIDPPENFYIQKRPFTQEGKYLVIHLWFHYTIIFLYKF